MGVLTLPQGAGYTLMGVGLLSGFPFDAGPAYPWEEVNCWSSSNVTS